MQTFLLFLLTTLFNPATSSFYGLIRDKNSPSCSGAPSGCTNLVSINPANGTITKIGPGHTTLAAVGDLAKIDADNHIYYYLGDGWNGTGTLLITLDLNTGTERCQTNLNAHIKTLGIVGGEQSLSIVNQQIFVTGITSASGPHVILVAPLPKNGCPTFQAIGSFPYSGNLPVAHSTTIDASNDRLYSTVSTGKHTYGIDVIHLKTGTLNRTIGEYFKRKRVCIACMKSTVVDISIPPPSFKPVSLSFSRISSILKHPNKSFLTQ